MTRALYFLAGALVGALVAAGRREAAGAMPIETARGRIDVAPPAGPVLFLPAGWRVDGPLRFGYHDGPEHRTVVVERRDQRPFSGIGDLQ